MTPASPHPRSRHSARPRTGRPYPLGATWDGRGVNFALYSRVATGVRLCLFDGEGGSERQVPLARRGSIWFGYVPGAKPGDAYGYRVDGPYQPAQGQRCNPHKLLLDPYARAIAGELKWGPEHYGYVVGDEAQDLSLSTLDSAPTSLRGQVVDNSFDWGTSAAPDTPWRRTVIYEVHVKGFTQNHPGVPQELRGTYAGLAAPAAIQHFKRLGITAVELLPVHAFLDDHRLVELGLRNYWGYNTIGFFAPEPRYAADRSPGGAVREFKQMVKTLHEAGLEVILDVVYNHTAEGNHLGPTLSFKGIDNAAYYRLSAEDPRYCCDYTGTGNTLDTHRPVVVKLIVDSLRYWATEMGVDGFRFDLATALGRGAVEFGTHTAFFNAIARDPVLSRVKLIAEPWDLGPNGYRVGGFPKGWAEWNGVYRDTVRSYWCRREGHITQLVQRLCGSADLYEAAGRPPTDSVNVVTVHDGFTLEDLVSYDGKHNDANQEGNNDGESHNRSWNCGVEGPTADALVLAQRARLKRNLLATLMFSQGTPLLLAGDEMARTQRGNNNGYCQDGPISWHDWTPDPRREGELAFAAQLIRLRRELAPLRRARFFDGQADAEGIKDVSWRGPEGDELTPERWQDGGLQAVAALMCGWSEHSRDDDEASARRDSALLLLNGGDTAVAFRLPELNGTEWTPRIDTCTESGLPEGGGDAIQGQYVVAARSLVLLTQRGRLPAGVATQEAPAQEESEAAPEPAAVEAHAG